MKAYVINREIDTDRLASFTANYPSCLPECTVWVAKTGSDVDTPDWWQSSPNRWSLVQNFIDILSEDNDEDIIIFEDDCIFVDDFETKYNEFMAAVPDDWDMIYLGAQHTVPPIKISDTVLKLTGSICGHAIIYRNSIKTQLADYFSAPNWGCIHMSDQRRAETVASGMFKAYSPITSLCGQSAGASTLINKYRGERWYSDYTYGVLDDYFGCVYHSTTEPIIPVSIAAPTEDTKCIVSLTSYKPRIRYLTEVLQNIINDKKYHFVLTLYQDDVQYISADIRNWINEGKLELIVTDVDSRAHKKYIHSFEKYIDTYPVITLDDDMYYTPDVLDTLYEAHLETPDYVIGHLGKLITIKDGYVIFANKWPTITGYYDEDIMYLPVGMGGILYPIGFKPTFDFLDKYGWDMNDDHSLHVSAIRQGIKSRNIPCAIRAILADDVQKVAWWHEHLPLSWEHANFYKDDILNAASNTEDE